MLRTLLRHRQPLISLLGVAAEGRPVSFDSTGDCVCQAMQVVNNLLL